MEAKISTVFDKAYEEKKKRKKKNESANEW